MSATPQQIDKGIWRWTARHPEWHPAGFGAEVASYALTTDAEALLIDPLLPSDPKPVQELIDGLADAGVAILITMPWHVRDAEKLRRRLGKRCTIWGHKECLKRMKRGTGFTAITPETELPAGVTAHAIGKPRRWEQPFWIPSHRALAFGDAVIENEGRLRIWNVDVSDERRERHYRERYLPTLKPLVALNPKCVLATHGEAVLDDAKKKLAAALRSKPFSRTQE